MLPTSEDIRQLNEKIQYQGAFTDRLREVVGRVIVGQHHMLDRLLIGLLSNGHVLLEGVPGLAKTLTIKSLAQAVQARFSRIQFTPDLLPADVIGTMIYQQQKNEFVVRKGPIFANFILADEINRAPAKVQSALLEAMQERQVTIGDSTYKLEEPFLVLATQNPLEQEGTYPLPEAQVDRFIMKVIVGYPSKQEEQLIIRQNVMDVKGEKVRPVVSVQDLLEAKELTRQIYMDEKVEQYILDIVFATRQPDQYNLSRLKPLLSYGGSPRASINLALAAKAYAYLSKRAFVIPDDVKAIARDVLRHRLGLTYEAEAENVSVEQVIEEILKTIAVP
ncbi:AAA family ATPase [Flavihumibacter petaseus]|uniref:Putative ATPase n=1 Tax=Flavihumibacter petaseus NBRC 106054 TaxID=1220578 RepID=A0A0E9MWA3_9BACT|nr:MoxR family ATPase [Flavihumibacter petaseus]GAO41716.1 putative ATPase [Flavihumibacter petaseus NBRC 106054]